MKFIKFLLLFFGYCFVTTMICPMTGGDKKEPAQSLPDNRNRLHNCFSHDIRGVAVTEGYVRQLLDEGVDRTQRDSKGKTPLDYALFNTSEEMVETLLTYKCTDRNFVNNRSNNGDSPLHNALENLVSHHPVGGWAWYARPKQYTSNRETILLLLMYGADPNQPNNHGETPTHYLLRAFAQFASRQRIKYQELVELFIVYGASLALRDKKGTRPIDYIAIPEQAPKFFSGVQSFLYDWQKPFSRVMYDTILKAFVKKDLFAQYKVAPELVVKGSYVQVLKQFDALLVEEKKTEGDAKRAVPLLVTPEKLRHFADRETFEVSTRLLGVSLEKAFKELSIAE